MPHDQGARLLKRVRAQLTERRDRLLDQQIDHVPGAILAERPDGPYLIGGYSIGGRIALELALRLQKRGKQVPALIIFDEFAPGSPRPLPPSAWSSITATRR